MSATYDLWTVPKCAPRPQGGGMQPRSIVDRFMQKVIVTPDCWAWSGGLSSQGYARLGRGMYAHRISYEIYVGPIPDGTELDHLCRNRGCVNPDHLEAVSHRENVRRGIAGQQGREKTHCPQGHPYDLQNTYRRPDRPNTRDCRTCMSERVRKHRRRTADDAA